MKKLLFIFLILSITVSKAQNKEVSKEKIIENNSSAVVLENAVLAGGLLYRIASFPSKYCTPRPVDIWLPENYSEDKKYAVLYMHDGQNLFDATTTWNAQEWEVDEVASQLMNNDITKDFIVVGIHNIPEIRWQDLFPEKAMNFLSVEDKEGLFKEAVKNNFSIHLKGDAYLKFLVEELKPFIDKTYAVHKNKENTFVAGSSMGGLMSMYAISEYPTIFAGAACISTHWPGAEPKDDNKLAEAIFNYMKANVPNAGSHKLYFDYGNKTLDENYPKYAPRVDEVLSLKGYSNSDSMNLFFEGTDHSEKSWQERIHIPFTFLLKK